MDLINPWDDTKPKTTTPSVRLPEQSPPQTQATQTPTQYSNLQFSEGLSDKQKNQLTNRLDRVIAGDVLTDTDKANFNYGLGSSWQSYIQPTNVAQTTNYQDIGKATTPVVPPAPPATTTNSLISRTNEIQTNTQNKITDYKNLFQEIRGKEDDYIKSQYDTSVQGLKDLMMKDAEKTQALAEAYKSGGVEQYQKILAELNMQSAQLQGSYLTGLTDIEGKRIPMHFITGQQAQMEKQYAVKSAAIALEQQAVLGNIENARAISQEMVDLQYGDIEKQIAYQKDLINLNYQELTSSEKRKADEMNFVLNMYEKDLEEQKSIESNLNNLAISALEMGAPTEVAQSIMKSGDIGKGILMAGEYLNKTIKTNIGLSVPTKIGQNSNGEDIFFVDGEVFTGDKLLGYLGGGGIAFDESVKSKYSQEAWDWAEALRDNPDQFKISDIKNDKIRSEVASINKIIPPSDAQIKEAEKFLGMLKELYDPETEKTHTGLNSAVGPLAITRIAIADKFGNKDDFLAKADQVISKTALENLIEAKSRGATFGALSEKEMSILKAAASALGSRAILDKNNKLKGFDISEKFFKEEIDKIIKSYDELLNEAYSKTINKSPDGQYDINNPLGINKEAIISATTNPVLAKITSIPDGQVGGQCGKFVNQMTNYKLSLGDSYANKMSKMDTTIKYPEAGMVFVTPYKDTGHTGFILAVNNDGTVVVKESNFGLNEKVGTRVMPISTITGLARV